MVVNTLYLLVSSIYNKDSHINRTKKQEAKMLRILMLAFCLIPFLGSELFGADPEMAAEQDWCAPELFSPFLIPASLYKTLESAEQIDHELLERGHWRRSDDLAYRIGQEIEFADDDCSLPELKACELQELIYQKCSLEEELANDSSRWSWPKHRKRSKWAYSRTSGFIAGTVSLVEWVHYFSRDLSEWYDANFSYRFFLGESKKGARLSLFAKSRRLGLEFSVRY
jgi:hypothetical protein